MHWKDYVEYWSGPRVYINASFSTHLLHSVWCLVESFSHSVEQRETWYDILMCVCFICDHCSTFYSFKGKNTVAIQFMPYLMWLFTRKLFFNIFQYRYNKLFIWYSSNKCSDERYSWIWNMHSLHTTDACFWPYSSEDSNVSAT